MTAEIRTLDITGIGAEGDGLAATETGPVYVPMALPGERIRAEVAGDRGRLVEMLSPAPNRARPVCRHFGACGGCVAQHMPVELYRDWKRRLVATQFSHRGIAVEVGPLVTVEGGSRRRAVLTARRVEGRVALGFHRLASHDIEPIRECPVLSPQIVAALPVLAQLCAILLGDCREVRCTVLATQPALDVSLEIAEGRVGAPVRAKAAQHAAANGLARVSIDREVILLQAKPTLMLGAASVAPPPGAFVQAVAAAENAMADRVMAALGKAKRVADLFCGVGTFTLRLARQARVLAVDSDRAAIAALIEAARVNQGLKPIETKLRDLLVEPLSPKELEGFDAVIFDPPRAGAKAQAETIARSKVKRVISVSCNPATLARDAAALIAGGFSLDAVTPIDQFLYSAHVEVVAVLSRK